MGTHRMDVPVGTVIDYAGDTPPAGYLECDGSAVSRKGYPELFAAIGTLWGAGDGSTTFNLPNLGGRACIGRGSRSVGNTGGSETHTLTVDELPSHKHTVPVHGHGHSIKATTPKLTHTITQPVFKLPNHEHGVRGGWGAGSTDTGWFRVDTNSPKVKWSPTTNPTSLPNCTRSTNVGVGDHAATACTMSGGVSDKAAFDTNGSGGSSHSIMQPYAVVRKVIRAA